MPRSRFAGSLISPKVDVVIDMGNPFLNHTVDAFLKIGTVAATKTAAEETYEIVKRGSVSNPNFEKSLKKMCKEGAYWGTVAGVYTGMVYGAERIRGTRDWVICNASLYEFAQRMEVDCLYCVKTCCLHHLSCFLLAQPQQSHPLYIVFLLAVLAFRFCSMNIPHGGHYSDYE